MPDPARLLAFCAASLALILVPGPNLVYIVTHSVAHGRRTGLVSVLGVESATLVHLAAAVFGVSALITRSETAFATVKYAGAAYLLVLGVRALRQRGSSALTGGGEHASAVRVFREGALVNLLNPKVTLFFLAFFPQFVDNGAGTGVARAQMLTLSVVFLTLSVTLDATYALAGGALSGWLHSRPGVLGRQHLAVGGVYLALGAMAALA
ncbi:LysE family translocator [Streptomyces sp. N2-109]|uniref:LysE family translocator n=1 Tax=Streptomyces gossypii TaxID=2883101 RepID=A0ABT2JZ53_9ACTN|nr:LysE family translocator [Streptomyces gossypii]MCT2593188.1 LysE family translocator [Streptomyces gossypii]